MAITAEEKRTYEPQIRPPTGRPLGEAEVRAEAVPFDERPLWDGIYGATIVGFAGGAAAVLAILGLAGIVPRTMLSIATIGLGGAFLLGSASMAWRFPDLLRESFRDYAKKVEFYFGLSAAVVTGLAGIAFGILSLLNVQPFTLISIASLVFGAALVLSSSVIPRINDLRVPRPGEHDDYWYVARESILWATDIQKLVGPGGITLGILGLAGVNPMTLLLVAVLAIGCSIMLAGTFVCARCLSYLRH